MFGYLCISEAGEPCLAILGPKGHNPKEGVYAMDAAHEYLEACKKLGNFNEALEVVRVLFLNAR